MSDFGSFEDSPMKKRQKTSKSLSKSLSKKSASRTIKKFMSKSFDPRTIHSKREKILKKYCPSTSTCLTIGKYRHTIYKFFNNFTNFDYVVSPIKRIGEKSANGFVCEIKYERDNIQAYTVLKSSLSGVRFSDSLVYEYMVGLFINQQSSIYPCFVETYGLFFYRDINSLIRMEQRPTIEIVKNELVLQENMTDFPKFCEEWKTAAIMIQHLKPVKTLGDWFNGASFTDFMVYEMAQVLYQVYMPLANLALNFTHYDLHFKNILLLELSPDPSKYIQYHYVQCDKTVSFRSRFIVKIIDYGQSFYEYRGDEDQIFMNPSDVYDAVCKTDKCTKDLSKSKCGINEGFGFLTPSADEKELYKSSLYANPSCDLRTLNGFKGIRHILNKIPDQNGITGQNMEKLIATRLLDLFDKVKYGVGIKKKSLQSASTEPNWVPGYDTGTINNVMDAEAALGEFIMQEDYQGLNLSRYSSPDNCIGTMTIDPTRKLKYA